MDDELLKKFFAGQCSDEEHDRVLSWYQSGKAEKELSGRIEAYWNTIGSDFENTWGKEAVFNDLLQRLPEQSQLQEIKKPRPRGLIHNSAFRYAASVAVLLMFAALWYIFTKGSDDASSTLPNRFTHWSTARGEKTQFMLPDGTKVIMNADSRIRYNEDFASASERVVYFEGEAFFDVSKDPLRPFIIHSYEVITTVLGTSFNVHAFAEEDIIVSVVAGKVKVQEPLEAVYLHSGEQAVYGMSDRSLFKENFDPSSTLAWKEGTLYFKNERFGDIVKKLERWYGVTIEAQKINIEDGFTGSYHHKSLDAVMEGMGFVLGFDYEIKGNQVVIK